MEKAIAKELAIYDEEIGKRKDRKEGDRKMTVRNGSNVAFPSWLKARLTKTNEKVSLADLKEEYEKETGRKRSRRTWARLFRLV